MGISSSSSILGEQPPPQKLSDFKQLAIAPEEYSIPEIPQKRVSTDKYLFIILVVSLLLLFILLIYTLCYSDMQRYTNGYDNCGNVCGKKNEYVSDISCSGKDMRGLNYLQYNVSYDYEFTVLNLELNKCVESCDDDNMTYYITIGHRCFQEEQGVLRADVENKFIETWEDFSGSLGRIVGLTVISIGLCFVMVVLFRYATALLIWGTIIGCYTVLIIFTLYLWFADSKNEDDALAGAICITVVSIIVTLFLISVFKKIPLVVNIFREAMKAIFAMPLIVFEPLLTFLALFITILLFFLTTAHILTAGVLVNIGGRFYAYEPNGIMIFTIFLNVLVVLWMIKFIMGCQVMVISGAISTWYFSRDKTFLGNPIRASLNNLVKYHLGSVALGSLLLTAADIIKALLKVLVRNKRTKFLADCCMGIVQSLLVYISKNAYIQIAMHGENFFRSGRRAIQLICLNLRDVIAINSIGDFVLFMAKLFIVVCTVIFGTLIQDFGYDKKWNQKVLKYFWLRPMFASVIDTEKCTTKVGDCRNNAVY